MLRAKKDEIEDSRESHKLWGNDVITPTPTPTPTPIFLLLIFLLVITYRNWIQFLLH